MKMGEAQKKVDLSEDRLFPLGWGLVYKVVCAPEHWTADRVSDEATRMDPPGTSANRWVATSDEGAKDVGDREGGNPFKDGNPIQCPDCENRRHWLVNC